MIKQVEKRDGRVVEFNPCKIKVAIQKAMESCNIEDSYKEAIIITDNVMQVLEKENKDSFTIEHIQDIVEKELMRDFPDVAKAYILYRNERSRIRENKSELMQIVEEKLFAKNVQNQNANVDERSFGGCLGEVKSEIVKRYALEKSMSKMARDNHLNNLIYIHDLDSYAVGMHNCLTLPTADLLKNGFKVRNTYVRPANSINTAMQVMVVAMQCQSQCMYGGVSEAHLDWTMVPYVRKSFMKHYKNGLEWIEELNSDIIDEFVKSIDIENTSIEDDVYKKYNKVYKYALKLTTKETCQAVEGMYHNLNTLQSRAGNQLPFSSVNSGTCILPEGRMITKALLEGCIKGTGYGETSIFPCVIFQYKRGVNDKPGTPNYDLFRLALKSTAKRLYPNYCNVDCSLFPYDENDPDTYLSTMGEPKSYGPCKISRTSA